MHTGKERQQEKENVLSIDNKGNLEEKKHCLCRFWLICLEMCIY